MTDYDVMPIITKIVDMAGKLHDETNQKYDDKPYSYHTTGVAHNAMRYVHQITDDTMLKVAIVFGAAFHDSIEDARQTYNDVMKIARTFMPDEYAFIATEIVYACTNEKGRNRDERANDKYYEGIRTTPYASFVKLCDRLFNMSYSKNSGSRMFKKYCEENAHFLHQVLASPDECDGDYNQFKVPDEIIDDLEKLME